jgi:carbon storage regulator
MLVLGRKHGESICIGDDIEITVVGIEGNRIRLGIQAPHHVRVLRAELNVHQPQDWDAKQAGLIRPKSSSRADRGTAQVDLHALGG